MAGCSWQEHGGVPYLYSDQRTGTDAEHAATILESWRMRTAEPGPVVVVADVRGSRYMPSRDMRAEIKRLQYESSQRHPTTVVIVGLERMAGVSTLFVRGLSLMGGGVRLLPARSWEHAMELVPREHARLVDAAG